MLRSFHVSSIPTEFHSRANICATVEFFVGIGDINSSFLPKQVPIAALPPDANRPASPPSDIASPGPTPPLSPFSSASTNSDTSEEELAEIEKTEILARNADVLDAQLEERPLAKMQEELQEAEDAKEEPASEDDEPGTCARPSCRRMKLSEASHRGLATRTCRSGAF